MIKPFLDLNFTLDDWVSNLGNFLALKTRICHCPQFEVVEREYKTFR